MPNSTPRTARPRARSIPSTGPRGPDPPSPRPLPQRARALGSTGRSLLGARSDCLACLGSLDGLGPAGTTHRHASTTSRTAVGLGTPTAATADSVVRGSSPRAAERAAALGIA